MEDDEIRVYTPEELYFDATIDPWGSGCAYVFIIDKENEDHDCLDDDQISIRLPKYLFYSAENEWVAENQPEITVDQVMADMLALGFEYKKLIKWGDMA